MRQFKENGFNWLMLLQINQLTSKLDLFQVANSALQQLLFSLSRVYTRMTSYIFFHHGHSNWKRLRAKIIKRRVEADRRRQIKEVIRLKENCRSQVRFQSLHFVEDLLRVIHSQL